MTALALPTTVVLHLGAHKTASTHLQHSIKAAMPIEGIAYAGPPELRGANKSLPDRFGFPLGQKDVPVSVEAAREALLELSKGANRLVLSEENFAGPLRRGLKRDPKPLYFTASKRIARLAQIIAQAGGPPLDLCLGIRNPSDYLGSAYVQILRSKPIALPQKYRGRNPLEGIDWVDYCNRLRATPGVGRLTVWRIEDYHERFDQISFAMMGTSKMKPLSGRVQKRLSEKAVDAILLAKDVCDLAFIKQVARELPVRPDNPPYDLFDAEAHMQSHAIYAKQWEAISAMCGITVL